MLQNRIYRGEVHKKGEHPAIVDQDLWDRVQAVLAENRADRAVGRTANNPSLLAGLIYDAAGHRMSPIHAVKGGRRYHYYVLATANHRRAVNGRRRYRRGTYS
jgi:hypothetical protein